MSEEAADKSREAQRAREREIILSILGGDPAAYRQLVETYQGRIYGMVCGMVRDPEEARDVTQDVFIKAYQSLERFRIDSNFYTWIYRIAMHRAIDHLRKKKRRPVQVYDDEVATHHGGELSPDHARESPDATLQRSRLRAQIQEAISKLSPDHRQVIVLRELEGLSYREIAEILEVPEGTVMSRLFHARRKLLEVMQPMLEREDIHVEG